MGEDVDSLAIFGFGVAANLVTQMSNNQRKRVFAFTRPGHKSAQNFSIRSGAYWEFLSLTAQIPVHPEYKLFPLESLNMAIHLLRNGKFNGTVVIDVISSNG